MIASDDGIINQSIKNWTEYIKEQTLVDEIKNGFEESLEEQKNIIIESGSFNLKITKL